MLLAFNTNDASKLGDDVKNIMLGSVDIVWGFPIYSSSHKLLKRVGKFELSKLLGKSELSNVLSLLKSSPGPDGFKG